MSCREVRFSIRSLRQGTHRSTAQKHLRDLKSKISSQSKKNFVLEKDVRYLDSRIALLIQNRMALEEVLYPCYLLGRCLHRFSKTKSPAISMMP